MRRATLLLVPLLLASGCTGDAATSGPDVPSAESFADGTCSTVAEDVRTIGRLLPQVGDGPSVDTGVLDSLRTSQEALRAVADGAEPGLQGPLKKLSQSVGFIRIRGVGNTYEPFIGEQAQEAYEKVIDACTEN